jgi:hypothetical protein
MKFGFVDEHRGVRLNPSSAPRQGRARSGLKQPSRNVTFVGACLEQGPGRRDIR